MTTIDRKTLLRAVQLAASITPRNTPKASLKGVLIKANRGKLSVFGTDLEASINIDITGNGDDTFEALPDALRIVQVLTECPDDEVVLLKENDSLLKENDSLYVKGQFAETVLQDCDNPETYPQAVAAGSDEPIILNAGKFTTALKRVAFCAARESARYALQGVRLEPADGKLTLIATDGKRMAVEELDCPTAKQDAADYVIPSKVVKLIQQACKGDEDEVTINLTLNTVTVLVDGVTVNGKLLEGRYPTWREVFPKKYDYSIPLTAGSLLTVTRQASVMTTEDTRGIEYAFAKSELTAKSSSETGKARIKLPVAYDEQAVGLTMAGDLVTEMLGVWPADTELRMRGLSNNTVTAFEFPDGARHLIVPLSKGVAA